VILGAWEPHHDTDVGGVNFEAVTVTDGFNRDFLDATDAAYNARFRQKFTLEDAIGILAVAPLEALACV
jgi:hypothetical protein